MRSPFLSKFHKFPAKRCRNISDQVVPVAEKDYVAQFARVLLKHVSNTVSVEDKDFAILFGKTWSAIIHQ